MKSKRMLIGVGVMASLVVVCGAAVFDAPNAEKNEPEPGDPTVPGAQPDVKDSKRFADSGGWDYGEFEYDPAAKTFRVGNEHDKPPQEHDAKCGYACHTVVQNRDYVFTQYGAR